MDLKVKDVADLLNVTESTVMDWVKEGKIPAYRINDHYRFSRMEVEDWVMSQNQVEPEKATGGSQKFSLYRAIHKGGVVSNLKENNKEELIRSTMKVIARDLNLDSDVVSELLIDREKLQPTALSHGIAIPHTRDQILNARQDLVTVVFPETPIPYGALDNQPVHTLFFLFACDDKRHLHLLAKIAHLSSQPTTVNFLKTRPTKEKLLEYIKGWEGKLSSEE